MESVRRLARGRWNAWLDRRIPARSEIVLTQKRIFILPTGMGLGYLVATILLFIAGINYDNTLILNFSFFLASLFVVSILQTFANLSGLKVGAGTTEPAFAGDEAKFIIHLAKTRNKEHHSLQCCWQKHVSENCHLVESQKVSVAIMLRTVKRGWYRPGRLKLQTVYPFGLCRAWTWVDLDMLALVYPQPHKLELKSLPRSAQDVEGSVISEGQEDFSGLRAYTTSDSLHTVDWKAYARRNQLYTKEFHGYQSRSVWLRWTDVPVSDLETKLSGLCFWVLELSRNMEPYGLELPGLTIEPGAGQAHEAACLKALAEFNYG